RLASGPPTPRRLAPARQVVATGVGWRGADDVWFSPSPLLLGPAGAGPAGGPGGRGGLAFLFCGLEHSFTPRVDDVAHHFGLPSPELGGTDALGGFGLAGLAVNWLLDEALRRLGVVPDVVAGHSIGEWNAMLSTGMVRAEAFGGLLPLFRPDVVEVPGVVFAALGAAAADVGPLLAGLGDVVVSHDNSPGQSVVCGPREQVETAVRRARAVGRPATELSFRSGFHSPHLAPHLAPFRGAVDGLPLHPPSVPVWSATTVAPYPADADAVRGLVLRHLVEPVRFRPLVEALHDAGARVFVQVGVGSVARFVTETLAERDHAVVVSNATVRPGLDQLRRVCAALWAEGAAPRTDLLPQPASPLTAPPAPGPRSTPSRPEAEAGTGRPAITVSSVDPPPPAPAPARAEHVTRRTLSARELPEVLDHCFYRQPPGWPDLSDRFPVVPMTAVLELMLDQARELVPGQVVRAVTDVRMYRWLVVEPPVEVTLTGRLLGPTEVRVELRGHARCTVHLEPAPAGLADEPGPAARARPGAAVERLPDEELVTVRPADLYGGGWLFHGPGYQGLAALWAISPRGARGELVCPPARGGLLDSVGQLFGYWAMEYLPDDGLLLPLAVGRIAFHGPAPAPGERVSCLVRVVDVARRTVTADITVRDPDGTPRITIEGWADRRFGGDADLLALMLQPERKALGAPGPRGVVTVHDRWTDPASRELAVRHYLDAADRAAMAARTPRDGQAFLLARMAAKDAVRHWLWRNGAGDVWGIEIALGLNAGGTNAGGTDTDWTTTGWTGTGDAARAAVDAEPRGPEVRESEVRESEVRESGTAVVRLPERFAHLAAPTVAYAATPALAAATIVAAGLGQAGHDRRMLAGLVRAAPRALSTSG
ncbi:acyltransferase domain-containing protein, partial [Frankia nepalensis]|uniref:acyltransferase domain-containing protein n=1 Tax=Frankia nepalensis TaxID=1836974 RepID=UPI001931ED78